MEEEKNRLNQDHVDGDEQDEEEEEEEEEDEEEETIIDRLNPQKKRKCEIHALSIVQYALYEDNGHPYPGRVNYIISCIFWRQIILGQSNSEHMKKPKRISYSSLLMLIWKRFCSQSNANFKMSGP